MRPGERIVEKELCKEMQVSRTPLREAFNRLSLEGLIVLSPYRGYAVAPVTVQGYQELCALDRHQRPLYLGLDVGIDGEASTREHLEISEAVVNHDSEKARTLMVQHIAQAEERIVSALRAAGY
jgi:DNA-binding GntR family transcriptional regulator